MSREAICKAAWLSMVSNLMKEEICNRYRVRALAYIAFYHYSAPYRSCWGDGCWCKHGPVCKDPLSGTNGKLRSAFLSLSFNSLC